MSRSPNPHFCYIAPYRSQAKSVAWDYLKTFAAPVTKASNEAELQIDLINGGRIRLFGADNADAMRGLGFEYERALVPVTQLTLLPSVLMVRADSPHNTLARLVAHLRANPGRESYGSSGTGTGAHLSGALLMRRAGTEAQHIPYRGGAQQMTAMLTGETLFAFSTLAVPAPLLAEGRLTAIAASSAERIPGYDNVSTVAEQGMPGFDMVDFHQISAPSGTPTAMIARMAEAAAEAMHSPALAARFQLLGLIPRARGPEDFAAFLAQQRQRMGEVIRAEGLQA
jgi:tripartite-type tricarboxylate transporter receptor subunit TctC